MAAWPRIGTALVVASFAIGLIEGIGHWAIFGLNGYGIDPGFHAASFAEMLPLMIVAVLVGSLSANLGLTLVLGFALGDFFIAGAPYSPWLAERIAQLAAYLVFFFLAVWPTVAGRFLTSSLHRRFRESGSWNTGLMVVVQSLFVFEWTYFAAMGVKQQWDCCSLSSQLDVRYFHETTAPWLVAAAIIGVIARHFLSRRAEREAPLVLARTTSTPPSSSKVRIPQWLHAIVGAVVMTLLLLGFAVTLWRTLLVFVLIAGILLARSYLFPKMRLWIAWLAAIVRFPALVRLAAATVATYFIGRAILEMPGNGAGQGNSYGDFGPELSAFLLGYALLLVLVPDGALSPKEADAVRRPSLPNLSPAAAALLQAAGIFALVLLSTKKAYAGLCLDRRCCLNGDNGIAASATAAGIPSAAATAQDPDPCQAEKDAVQKDEDRILNLQTSINAEEQILAGLQQQVRDALMNLQSMAGSVIGESATNPALAGLVGPLASTIATLNTGGLYTPGATPDQFFSNPVFASINAMAPQALAGLALAQMSPTTLNFLMQVQQLLPLLSVAANQVSTIRDQQLELQTLQELLDSDKKALADCEASHGGAKKTQ